MKIPFIDRLSRGAPEPVAPPPPVRRATAGGGAAYTFKLSNGQSAAVDSSILANTRRYYNSRYQGAWEVERARRATQVGGYGSALVRIPVNAAVGPTGFEIKFDNPVHQMAWDMWRWNVRRPWERFDEALRDAAQSIIRDGEAMAELSYYQGGVVMRMIDPLDVPIGIRESIKIGPMGEPLSYYVRPYISGQDPYLIPEEPHIVSAANFVHVFGEDFPRQVRGISWMRPALERLHELEELLSAGYASIKRTLNLGGIIRLDKSWDIEPIIDADGNYLDDEGNIMDDAAKASYAKARLAEALTTAPDKLATVKADKDEIEYLELSSQVPLPAGYKDIVVSELSNIARSVGLSYFSLTGDVSSANYSSLRFGLATDRNTTMRVQRLLEGFVDSVIDKWGYFMSVSVPGWPEGWNQYKVIKPRPPDIDPVKDAQARQVDVNTGYKSVPELITEDGRDPEKVKAEILEWREAMGGGMMMNGGDDDAKDDDAKDANSDADDDKEDAKDKG